MKIYIKPILIVVAVLVIYGIAVYNSLVSLRQKVSEAWSDIDVQLKRRYDLIPNLVETVKGYATHESTVFEDVTKARSQAMNASGLHDKSEAENMLSGTLKSLFAVSESYPELKANENFLELQRELSDTENKIQASRRFYNSVVMSLNTKIESFPDSVVASIGKFEKKEYFEIAEAEKENVKVSF
ncbi:MAG: LemA family protein [Minisyncoccia bacterium]